MLFSQRRNVKACCLLHMQMQFSYLFKILWKDGLQGNEREI